MRRMMMPKHYDIVQSSKFKRDLKLVRRRGYNLSLLGEVVDALARGEILPPRFHDHALIGEYNHCRECHIAPDWLLIYERSETKLILYLTRTGTRSDLF